MIELDYRISSTSPERNAEVDLACADEGALHYDFFLGDVIFRVAHADFSTSWGWVPVLDFAIGLVRVLESLTQGASESFEFTESEATLSFVRTEANVTIVSANYAEGTATVSYEELSSCARKFLCHVLGELQSTYPSLERNPSHAQLRRERCKEE